MRLAFFFYLQGYIVNASVIRSCADNFFQVQLHFLLIQQSCLQYGFHLLVHSLVFFFDDIGEVAGLFFVAFYFINFLTHPPPVK